MDDAKCATCHTADAVPPYCYCNPCKRAYDKKWRADNPEQFKRLKRRGHLAFRYGITPERWQAMWDENNGLCELCSAPLEEGRQGAFKACVDHDHDTGKVRGLLCSLCNVGIGSFRDDPDTLERAAYYLRRHAGTE